MIQLNVIPISGHGLIEVPDEILVVSLVMVFGWTGAPGEYMCQAWACKLNHESYRPSQPAFNDDVQYSSKWLMDDPVILSDGPRLNFDIDGARSPEHDGPGVHGLA